MKKVSVAMNTRHLSEKLCAACLTVIELKYFEIRMIVPAGSKFRHFAEIYHRKLFTNSKIRDCIFQLKGYRKCGESVHQDLSCSLKLQQSGAAGTFHP